MERVYSRLNHVGRRVEIRFSDFEVDDALTLLFERSGPVQDFKRRFGAKPRHPAGKTQFELCWSWHGGGWHYSPLRPESARSGLSW